MRKKLRRPKNFPSQINVKLPETSRQQKDFVDAQTDELPEDIRKAVIEVIERKFKEITEQQAS